MDYSRSNDREMSCSKSFIALLGNKGLLDFYHNCYESVFSAVCFFLTICLKTLQVGCCGARVPDFWLGKEDCGFRKELTFQIMVNTSRTQLVD